MTVLRKIDHGVECDNCHFQSWMPTSDTIRPGPIRTYREKLRAKGWLLGAALHERDYDICPSCRERGVTVDDIH